MNPEVQKQFDAVADVYDRQRRQLIPCFDDFYGTALLLADIGKPAPRVLDLGAGTGLFAGMVKAKLPEARLTLMDLSAKMLQGARKRLADQPDVQYEVVDYANYDFEPESYDIILSSLSIHHLTHADKQQLFRKIYEALTPDGVFVNADQARGETPGLQNFYRERWLADIHSSGLAQDAINASIERRKVDIDATLSDQLRWMEQAGFADVDCMYKNLGFVVFYGRKSPL